MLLGVRVICLSARWEDLCCLCRQLICRAVAMGFQIVSETSQQVVIPLQYIDAFKTNGHFSTIEPLDPFPQLTLAVLEGQTLFGEVPTQNLFINMLKQSWIRTWVKWAKPMAILADDCGSRRQIDWSVTVGQASCAFAKLLRCWNWEMILCCPENKSVFADDHRLKRARNIAVADRSWPHLAPVDAYIPRPWALPRHALNTFNCARTPARGDRSSRSIALKRSLKSAQEGRKSVRASYGRVPQEGRISRIGTCGDVEWCRCLVVGGS